MVMSSNWIHNNNDNELSLADKLRDLLKIRHKLVLVQVHELEKLKMSKHKDRHYVYINNLYIHYVIKGLTKTYLN